MHTSIHTEMRRSDREFRRWMRRYEECDTFVERLLKLPEGPEFDAALAKYERMVEAL